MNIDIDFAYKRAVEVCDHMKSVAQKTPIDHIAKAFSVKYMLHKELNTTETMLEACLMAHTLRIRVEDERNKKN